MNDDAESLVTTGDLRFSLQNRHADDRLAGELDAIGVSNRAVTLSGRATRSENEITIEDFLSADDGAIRERLKRFLIEHDPLRADDLVILDMEPRGFSPRALGQFEGKLQRDLIAAYRRRVHVAREVFRRSGVPGLRVGLYQVVVPDGRGRPTDGFERRLRGYLEAGRQGMYDELDFISPVLYQRFGADDAIPATVRRWVTAATRQAIDGSLALTTRDGAPIPLVPTVSFWVFNERSADNRRAASPDLVARQLEIVHSAGRVAATVFWSGWQSADEMLSANKPVEPIDIVEFLRSVGTSPWSGREPAESGFELAVGGASDGRR
jgi:hypothetical protein